MKLRVLLLAGSVLLLALPSLLPAAAAAEDTKRLAVLELRGVFEREELSVLSDQLRQGALAALKGTAYTVMTRENMAVLARNMAEATSAGAVLALARDHDLALADAVAGRARESALATLAGDIALDVVVIDRAGAIVGRAGA